MPDIEPLAPMPLPEEEELLFSTRYTAEETPSTAASVNECPQRLQGSQTSRSASLSNNPSPVHSDSDLCTLQTPDTSLSLGSLCVMTSLNNSESLENELKDVFGVNPDSAVASDSSCLEALSSKCSH